MFLAGGGGRPGGRPAFNWKERKTLGLDGASKELKARPIGDFNDIEGFMDPSRGDILVNLTDLEHWDEPEKEMISDGYRDARKTIQIGMLFGPNKIAGTILRKESNAEKPNFSHRRIFGSKSV
eukprot:gene3705-7368_t